MSASYSAVLALLADVLTGLGVTPDQAHLVGPMAWALAEGGWTENAATFNPLDTTLALPGSRPINTVGVQAYLSQPQGARATLKTLTNGLYDPVIEALRDGTPAELAAAVGASPWGTPARLIRSCVTRARSIVAFAAPAPAPAPVAHPQPQLDPQLPQEEFMNCAIASDGTLVVVAAGAGTRAGQLLVFEKAPEPGSTWTVTDVTDAIGSTAESPAYTVS